MPDGYAPEIEVPVETKIGQLLLKELMRPEGVICPCCTQRAKIYKRSITHEMAEDLIKLAHMPTGWHHVKAMGYKGGSGDFAKLAYWGLIEERPKDPSVSKKRTSGEWRITEKGTDFVLGTIKVKLYAHMYNKTVLAYSGEEVGITDCVDEFHYQELMNR